MADGELDIDGPEMPGPQAQAQAQNRVAAHYAGLLPAHQLAPLIGPAIAPLQHAAMRPGKPPVIRKSSCLLSCNRFASRRCGQIRTGS